MENGLEGNRRGLIAAYCFTVRVRGGTCADLLSGDQL